MVTFGIDEELQIRVKIAVRFADRANVVRGIWSGSGSDGTTREVPICEIAITGRSGTRHIG